MRAAQRVDGVGNQVALSPFVAARMKRPQSGTATSPAYPPDTMVFGWSNPIQTPATSFGV